MAARSEASGDEAPDAAACLMDSTLDEYIEVCIAVAGTMGFRAEEHEIVRKTLILKGRRRGKVSSVVAPIPSLRLPDKTLNSIIRAAAKGGRHVILLSPFGENPVVLKNRSLVDARCGADFIGTAARTAPFRRLRSRIEAGGEQPPGSAVRRYRELMSRAREMYDGGRLEAALDTVSVVLNIEPLSGEAFRLEGRIRLKSGDPAKALMAYESAARLDPGNIDSLFGRASALYALGRFEEELECYDTILRLKPGHRGALQNRGATLQQLGRLQEAVAAYGKLLRAGQRDTGVLRNLAIAEYRLGNADGALSVLDELLRTDTSDARALRMKGLILAEQGRAEALDYLSRYTSIEKDEDVMGIMKSLRDGGAARAEEIEAPPQDETAEPETITPPPVGEDRIQAAPGETPDELLGRMERGGLLDGVDGMMDSFRLLSALGTAVTAGAAAVLRERIIAGTDGEGRDDVLSLKEQDAFERGDYASAERAAKRMLSLSPSEPTSRRLAADLALQGRHEDALAIMRTKRTRLSRAVAVSLNLMAWKSARAQRILRDNHGFLFTSNRGMAVMQRKGPAAAADYLAASEWKGPQAVNNEAVSLILEGETQKGLALLRTVEKCNRWPYLFNLGAALLEAGLHEEAARALRRSIDMHESAMARNSLGVALAGLGDLEGAKAEFEKAASANPPMKQAEKNLRKLQRKLA